MHSPFVYSLVREVFLSKVLLSDSSELFDTLLRHGVAKRTALDIANLVIHCDYSSWSVDDGEETQCQILILLSSDSTTQIKRSIQAAHLSGTTVVIVQPNATSELRAMCDLIIGEHRSTIVEKQGYMIIFNNYLPKQYFRL